MSQLANSRSRLTRNITISVILHVLLFLVLGVTSQLSFLEADLETQEPNDPPLVFEFDERPRPKQVIETPDDAKIDDNKKDADFLSDKNAVARSEANPALDVGAPFQRGDVSDAYEIPTPQGPQGEAGQPARQAQKQAESELESEETVSEDDLYAANSPGDFKPEYLVKQPTSNSPGVEESRPKVQYENIDTQALESGGLSFNTYDWNFAPYMLAMKKKVERNIFPPPAFTRMGIINGETIVRFKVYPSGEVKDLQVLDFTGHHTLMETSRAAIEISGPFRPLPSDFSEPYLEVTAKFSYHTQKNR